jgi:hypothetical protein
MYFLTFCKPSHFVILRLQVFQQYTAIHSLIQLKAILISHLPSGAARLTAEHHKVAPIRAKKVIVAQKKNHAGSREVTVAFNFISTAR